MSSNTSILLNDHFKKFVRTQVESGRFTSASEVVRAGLRLLEQEAERRDAINKALIAGEESGFKEPFDKEAFKIKMQEKHG